MLLAAPVQAVLMQPLAIEELTDRADLVLHGTILEKHCERDSAGRIYTKLALQVEEAWKGKPAANPFVFVQAGGILGAERVVVSGQPEYQPGEEVVLFLIRNQFGEGVVIGLVQGKFDVWKDPATGEKLACNLFHGERPGRSGGIGLAGAPATERLSLTNLKSRIAVRTK